MATEPTPKEVARIVMRELVMEFRDNEYEGREDDFATRLDSYPNEFADAVIKEMWEMVRVSDGD